MKILADENIPMVKEVFSHLGDVITISGRKITKEVLVENNIEILLVRSITKVNENLLNGTDVKFVATATIGEDHIDKEYLSKKGIVFSSAPGSNAQSVAEYVFTALMILSKKYNFNLMEKTIGIIGVGNVGSRVKRLADALGIKTLLNDPPKKRETNSKDFIELTELLENSDIVTVHVPLTYSGIDATYELINEKFLKTMKNASILINSSRGKVMNENSIIKHRNKLLGLVLDVWTNEPEINEELLKLSDIGTAHIAGYSYDGKINGTRMIYEACCKFLNIKPDWKIDISDKNLKINLINSDNLIYDAFTKAYPIERDDSELRKILNIIKKEEKAKYFDLVRKNYPIRREFANYTLICKNVPQVNILKKVGFKVETV